MGRGMKRRQGKRRKSLLSQYQGRPGAFAEATAKRMVWRTLNSEISSAELCRRNHWSVGTLLVGDEGYGPTVIRLTAIGEEDILAVCVSHKGKPLGDVEGNWTLHDREWGPATLTVEEPR